MRHLWITCDTQDSKWLNCSNMTAAIIPVDCKFTAIVLAYK